MAAGTVKVSMDQLLSAARRHYHGKETQAALATELGVSPSHLARLFQAAERSGHIRVVIDSVREVDLAYQLRARYPSVEMEVIASRGDESGEAIGIACARFFDRLLDMEEETKSYRIRNVVIGGGTIAGQFVEHVARRVNRISVGPSALIPFSGKIGHHTAPTVAIALALKWGALPSRVRAHKGSGQAGHLVMSSVTIPNGGLAKWKTWHEELRKDKAYEQVLDFWSKADTVFLGGDHIDNAASNDRVQAALKDWNMTLDDLKRQGITATVASQFMDREGRCVPVGKGVPSNLACIPWEFVTQVSSRKENPGRVVLSVHGARAAAVAPLLATGVVTHFFCDTACATEMLRLGA